MNPKLDPLWHRSIDLHKPLRRTVRDKVYQTQLYRQQSTMDLSVPGPDQGLSDQAT